MIQLIRNLFFWESALPNYPSGLSLKLNAQLGLVNILPEGDSDNSVKNTGFGLSVGYRF
jgi:hypothetical protein